MLILSTTSLSKIKLRSKKNSQNVEQEDNKARLLEEEEARKQEAEAKDVSIADEIGTALTGGVKDTISSAVTLPERVQDMFNGEMQAAQAKGEDYEPEFNPLGGDNNKMNKPGGAKPFVALSTLAPWQVLLYCKKVLLLPVSAV